jgi:hypothetical protein
MNNGVGPGSYDLSKSFDLKTFNVKRNNNINKEIKFY